MEQADKYRVSGVRVINHMEVDFTDRYDGVPLTIPPGQTQSLTIEEAAHLFGYADGVSNDVMFRHVCKRQGWNTPDHIKVNPETGKSRAEELFGALEIKPVVYRLVEEKVDTEQPIPADRELADDELPAMSLKGLTKARQNVASG